MEWDTPVFFERWSSNKKKHLVRGVFVVLIGLCRACASQRLNPQRPAVRPPPFTGRRNAHGIRVCFATDSMLLYSKDSACKTDKQESLQFSFCWVHVVSHWGAQLLWGKQSWLLVCKDLHTVRRKTTGFWLQYQNVFCLSTVAFRLSQYKAKLRITRSEIGSWVGDSHLSLPSLLQSC